MDVARYPDDWVHDSRLTEDIGQLLVEHDLSWLQATTEVGYVLAQMLLACEDEGHRIAVAEVLTDKVLHAARTGQLPGEVLD